MRYGAGYKALVLATAQVHKGKTSLVLRQSQLNGPGFRARPHHARAGVRQQHHACRFSRISRPRQHLFRISSGCVGSRKISHSMYSVSSGPM